MTNSMQRFNWQAPSSVALGAFGLVFQVVLLREFLSVFGSNEVVIGLVMASWLFWSGIGSWLPKLRPSFPWLSFLLILAPWLGIATQISVELFPRLIGLPPGAVPGPGGLLTAVLLLPAPACVVQGAGFVELARSFPSHTDGASRVYLYEALGAVLGGGLTLVVFDSAVLLALGGVALGIAAAGFVRKDRKTLSWLVAALALSVLLWIPASSWFLENIVWRGYRIVDHLETPYGKTVAISTGSEVNLFINGRLHTAALDRERAEREFLPLLVSSFPKVENPLFLVLGGSVARSAYIVETMGKEFPNVLQILRDREQVALEVATYRPRGLPDGLTLDFREPLEVIRTVCRPPMQCLALLNLHEGADTFSAVHGYTETFFEKTRYTPQKSQGVRAVFLPLGAVENYRSPWRNEQQSMVAATLAQARHESVDIAELGSYLVFSGESGFPKNRSELTQRLKNLPSRFRSLTAEALESRFERQTFSTDTTNGFLVTEDHPALVMHSLAQWMENFAPMLVPKAFFSGERGAKILFVLSAVFFVFLGIPLALTRRFLRLRSFPWLFLSGVAGVMLELSLILAYQIRFGELYHQVGMLLAMFMAGMAAGTWLVSRNAGKRSLQRIALGLPGLLALVVLGALQINAGFTVFAVLLALTGGISGGLFAFGTSNARMNFEGETISWTAWANGVDHFGATLAAVLAPLLVLFLGVGATLLFLAAASLVCFMAANPHNS